MPAFFRSFLKPSTRAFLEAARRRQNSGLAEVLHGLFYLKWPEFYIRVGLGRGRTARLLRAPAQAIGRLFGLWDDDAKKRFAVKFHGKSVD